MLYSFGDIVVVPFPFTDQSATKKRPSVIVSSSAYNATRPDVVLMPLTSRVRFASEADDLVIVDWTEAGLLKPSALKPLIGSLAQWLVLSTLGALSKRDETVVWKAVQQIIGPTPA